MNIAKFLFAVRKWLNQRASIRTNAVGVASLQDT